MSGNEPKEKILLMDDPGEVSLLAAALTRGGFQIEAALVNEANLRRVFNESYAALLLAVGVPGPSAFDLLRLLRANSRVPVLLLIPPDHEADGILGLELGADDYLVRPVNQRVLIARLRALLRRIRQHAASPLLPPLLTRGALEMDIQHRLVRQAGKVLRLTAIEFDLLRALLEAPGQLLSREALVQAVLGRAYHPDDRSLDVHISKLRKKLSQANSIQAIRGAGYVFTAGDHNASPVDCG